MKRKEPGGDCKGGFQTFYIAYCHSPHGKTLLHHAIRYYKNQCHFCGKKFPSKRLTLRHLTFNKLGRESVGVDVVACCWKCRELKIKAIKSNSDVELVKVSPKAFMTIPKWKNEYHVMSVDRVRGNLILKKKTDDEIDQRLNNMFIEEIEHNYQ